MSLTQLHLLLGDEILWELQLPDQVLHLVIAVSLHHKMLKKAGIVQGEIDSPRTCYWLSRDRLAQLKSLNSRPP
jgi:hypothetical protein